MSGAYEEARELLREFGGLLGRERHAALEAEHQAYVEIMRSPCDFEGATRTMAARPRAFGPIVRGDAAPVAIGVSVRPASDVLLMLPAITLTQSRVRIANDLAL